MSEVREDAQAKADRLGLALIKPGPADVFVDIDSDDDLEEFRVRFDAACKLWPDASMRIVPPVSGKAGHCHVYVSIPSLAPLDSHERIALQAALNSDPFREMLAIYHGRAGYEHTSVFFEKLEVPAAEDAA